MTDDKKHNFLNVKVCKAAFSASVKLKKMTRTQNQMAIALTEIFEKAVISSKKFSLDIYVTIIQSDGAEMCAAINACSLALINANIQMFDFVVASSVGYSYHLESFSDGKSDDSLCFFHDVNHYETSSLQLPYIELAMIDHSEKVIYLDIFGRIHDSLLPKMIKRCLQTNHLIKNEMHRIVKEYYSNMCKKTAEF